MSGPGAVSRQIGELATAVLQYAIAERRPGPTSTAAFNAAQGDVIREARKLTALVDGLEPGAMPPAWRDRQAS